MDFEEQAGMTVSAKKRRLSSSFDL